MANLLVEGYYNWLLGFIDDGVHDLLNYSFLLEYLFSFEFYEIVKNDCNRVADGLNLRNKYAAYVKEHLYFLIDELPEYCTCLEMMVALAIRIENDILYDPDKGDRTGEWFWIMVSNLGLENYTDDMFDEYEVRDILEKFVERKYKKSGQGGLFFLAKSGQDMRNVEIWYQANYFFSEYLREIE